MKPFKFLLIASMALILGNCKKEDKTPEPDPQPAPAPSGCTPVVSIVNTDVSAPTTWDSCHIYVISVNQISVKSELIIQPGTVIKFKENVGDNAILVSASGKITAEGTSARPIVFTSYRDDEHGGDNNGDGTVTKPARKDWGGIILNNNNCKFKYCQFLYGGEGPDAQAGQPTLEFSYNYGVVDHCTFAHCGGETGYAGYGVVDARYAESPNLVVTNCIFYDNIKPLFLSPHNSVDNSNIFHNPADASVKNQLNGIFFTSTSNEATTDVSWLEDEVPFVLTGSTYVGNGKKIILAANVIVKVATLPSIGYNKISIREGSSSIQGYSLPGVVFTSYLDDSRGGDTNGDGNASSAAAGDWYGIQDNSASIGTNNNCYNWSNIYFAKFP